MKQIVGHSLKSQVFEGIHALDRGEWNALNVEQTPFLKHEFLQALESSGSVSSQAGWSPAHYACQDENGRLVAVAPQYLKDHSYGEYVFDWAWADAYQRHGLPYYPKLISAIPFTPCQSPRLLMGSGYDSVSNGPKLGALYQAWCKKWCAGESLSSWHVLFPNDHAPYQGMLKRIGVQYHWFNRGYEDFDTFLSSLMSRKRKMIKKERARIQSESLVMNWLSGDEISEQELDGFYLLYQSTYMKRGQQGYLTRGFFKALIESMPNEIRFLLVRSGSKLVAGALYFVGGSTLYGRYWGCLEHYDGLHFEVCYYQGIDFCLREGLKKFDAGAQGEHKLVRGFEPVYTHSYHHILHPGFEGAIQDFLHQEANSIEHYFNQAVQALPYKKEMDK